jgi:hypothetical protein
MNKQSMSQIANLAKNPKMNSNCPSRESKEKSG